MTEYTRGDTVRVHGFKGVALWFVEHPKLHVEHGQWFPCPECVDADDDCDYCDGNGGMYDDDEDQWHECSHGTCDCPRDETRAIVVMVGDDERHDVDVDDIEPLDRGEFCGTCGQIGCGHGSFQ